MHSVAGFGHLIFRIGELAPIVQRACHALALDDERITFHPILLNERGQRHASADKKGKRYVANERISQVWFAGSHANVGGGYPDDSLSYVSLCWMLKEAAACGLVFNCRPEADPDALAHGIHLAIEMAAFTTYVEGFIVSIATVHVISPIYAVVHDFHNDPRKKKLE